jgi:hypothetical protein
MKTVLEQSRNIPVKGNFDVVVIGGGPAGASAAIAAARTGVSVALIERYGYMGGQATGGLVIVLCGLTDSKRQIIKGICQETIGEMRKLDATKGWPEVTVDPEILKYVLDKAAMGSGVRVYLHSLVVDLIHNDQVVEYAVIQNKSGRQAIQGKVFIDATGDADSASWCDIKYYKPDKTELLPVTLTFRVGNVQLRKVRQYFRDHPQKWLETIDFDGNAEFRFNGWRMTTNKSEVWFDALFLKNIDATDVEDLTRAEMMSRKYVQIAFEEIRRIPGFGQSYVQDTAPQLGVRETRRIVGRYTLTKNDISEDFHDSIARARNYHCGESASLSIPFRCLVPQGVSNLLFAGRCISVSPDVFDSIREIPCCMATGEAAGIASALSALGSKHPADIDVKLLQDELIKRNAVA